MPKQPQTIQHRLTMAGEDYLETIYRIMQENPSEAGVKSVDVADQSARNMPLTSGVAIV